MTLQTRRKEHGVAVPSVVAKCHGMIIACVYHIKTEKKTVKPFEFTGICTLRKLW